MTQQVAIESENEPIAITLLRDHLRNGRPARMKVLSGSMRPFLHKDDHSWIEPCTAEELEPGDMISVTASPHPVTHRYIKTIEHEGERYLIIRGDQPLVYDPAWPVAGLLGRITGRERDGKWYGIRNGRGRQRQQIITRMLYLEERLVGNHQVDLTSLVGVEFGAREPAINGFLLQLVRRCFYIVYGVLIKF